MSLIENRFASFVQRAAEGRNSVARIALGTAIVVAVWIAGTIALMAAGAVAFSAGWLPDSWDVMPAGDPLSSFIYSRPGMAVTFLTLGAIWPGVWLAMRLAHKRRLATLFGIADRIGWNDFLRAMVATGIMAVLLSLFTLLTEPRVERTDIALSAWLLALLPLAALVLIQTSAEEVFFRGYLLQNLAQRFRSAWIWAVLPSAVFAALHWSADAQPWMNAMGLTAIFLIAMTAVLLVRVTGNLGAAMGMHFANNVAGLLFVSAAPPRQSLALYVTPPMGDPAWTVTDAAIGGAAQVMLVAGIAVLLLWRRSPLRLDGMAAPR